MVPTMNNLLVSYDLNRPAPTHRMMDDHMAKAAGQVSRVLETVWLVHTPWTANQLFDYVNKILTNDDRLMVVDAKDMTFRNLLKPTTAIQQQWNAPAPAPILPPGFGLGLGTRPVMRSAIGIGQRPAGIRRF